MGIILLDDFCYATGAPLLCNIGWTIISLAAVYFIIYKLFIQKKKPDL